MRDSYELVIMTDNAPHSDKRTRVIYDRFAGRYDCVMRPLERMLFARLRERVFQLLPDSARTLEVGAGTGANFKLYKREAHGVASEISSKMLDEASIKPRPSGITLVQANAEDLPFASHTFDAAFATLVFCSVQSPAKAFAELRRVVRPNGRVVLLEHVRPHGAFLGRAFDALNALTVPLFDDHFNRETADDAQRAGFHIESIEPHARGIVQVITLRNCFIVSSAH